jgi:hypothetical protein
LGSYTNRGTVGLVGRGGGLHAVLVGNLFGDKAEQ